MNQKKKFKITLISMICIISCFFVAGIVQTFVLKSKQNTLANTHSQTSQLEQEYNDAKSTHDYKSSNPNDEDNEDYSDDYYEDYWRSQGYGEDGDKKIEIDE